MSEYGAIDVRLTKAEECIELLLTKVNDSALHQARISERLDNLLVTLGELKQALSALQQKPAQRWETVVTQCIGLLAAALLGLLLGGI